MDPRGDTSHASELARLARLVELSEADRREALGDPLPPPSSPVAARFTGPALSHAFRTALRAERVGGDVEGVDCSEHPCILFGRLEGDEEDLEEIERSAALRPYEDDVLTLLLWATSREHEDAAQRGPRETALFAIAYYAAEDRTRYGEQLDRRLRAKTHVHVRPPPLRPVIELEPTDHPLAVAQREGISVEDHKRIALALLH